MNDSNSNGDEAAEINKIVKDAKELYERLMVDEKTANDLLCKANFINSTAVHMVEYEEIMDKLDEDNNDHPSQIGTIITEGRQLNRLRNENSQLKAALEDHQFALELIMSKYREQLCQIISYYQNVKEPTLRSGCDLDAVASLSSQVKEMSEIMMDAIEMDEENQMARDKIISQLKVENETLRELVKIALEYESIKKEDIPSDLLVKILQIP